MNPDSAAAYQTHALEFLRARDHSTIGARVAERWARSLQPGTEVIEIACGGGFPVTRTLQEAGLALWAVESSPTLAEQFRSRFPDIPIECARVQEAEFFARQFGAAIAIGLLFLLSEQDQIALIQRIAKILVPGARFLFTAPIETGTWKDITTGHECRSLGQQAYERTLNESGFRVIATYVDEGQNNYYEAERWTAERLGV